MMTLWDRTNDNEAVINNVHNPVLNDHTNTLVQSYTCNALASTYTCSNYMLKASTKNKNKKDTHAKSVIMKGILFQAWHHLPNNQYKTFKLSL